MKFKTYKNILNPKQMPIKTLKNKLKNHTITNYRLMKKKQMNCLESKMIKMKLKAKKP